jgi:putative phosphoribosyl transferase
MMMRYTVNKVLHDLMHLTTGLGEEVEAVEIPISGGALKGYLAMPSNAQSIVIFSHGSGSGRNSPRNKFVADRLSREGMGTLLLDLLTTREEKEDIFGAEYRFNIELLSARLLWSVDWVRSSLSSQMKIGLFGASTGAASALVVAAEKALEIYAVVSRGGRPDLAGPYLNHVYAPTLLIVGERDETVLELNRKALQEIAGEKKLITIPGATHLFEEPGALEEVAAQATRWFDYFLSPKSENQLLDEI